MVPVVGLFPVRAGAAPDEAHRSGDPVCGHPAGVQGDEPCLPRGEARGEESSPALTVLARSGPGRRSSRAARGLGRGGLPVGAGGVSPEV